MRLNMRRLQPVLGTVTFGLALVALGAAWSLTLPYRHVQLIPLLCLTCGLTTCLVVSQWFPIHIRYHSKTHLGTIPLYLMVALLPPAFAATAGLVGMLTGELLLRQERGGRYCDVAAQVGRYVFVLLLGSTLGHLPLSVPFVPSAPLVAAAGILWTSDFLTFPLVLSPLTEESPVTIIIASVRSAGLIEAAQYLIGLLGAVAARHELWTVILLALPTATVYLTAKRAKELQDSTRQILESMADAVDLRDPYTGGHSRRVTDYTAGTLKELGLQGPDVALIVAAARVHDIGKIAMPDRVLLKEGKLTDEERTVMQLHPEHGAEVLQRYPDFARGVEIVRHHHERWDGGGYPHGLRETAIPFGARIIAVADSFDAMTSDRPYRRGMPVAQAAGILRDGRGRQWDGAVVDAFLRSIAVRLEQPKPTYLTVVPPADEHLTSLPA